MLAISTKGIGIMDISQTTTGNKKVDEKVSDAFSSLMSMGADNKEQSEDSLDFPSTNTDNDNSIDDVKYEYKKNAKSDKYEKYQSSDNSVKVDKTKTIDTKDAEKVTEEVAVVYGQIKEDICAKLDIPEEKFDEALESLDMNISDLTDMSKLKSFLLEINDSKEVDLLINEDFANLINEVIDDVSSIVDESEIGFVFDSEGETFEQIINNATNILEKASDNISAVNNADEVNDVSDNDVSFTEDDVFVKDDSNPIISSDKENEFNESVKVVVETDDNKNFSKSDSKEFKTDSVVNNLNKAFDDINLDNVEANVEVADNVNEADIVRQIVDEIKVNMSKDVTKLELRLNPENLGRVQVTVASKNGVMQAKIVAESEAAKKAIENSIETLKETFNNNDLKVEAVEVTIASYGFFAGEDSNASNGEAKKSPNSGKANFQSDSDDDELEMSEDESIRMKADGSSVSYSI